MGGGVVGHKRVVLGEGTRVEAPAAWAGKGGRGEGRRGRERKKPS